MITPRKVSFDLLCVSSENFVCGRGESTVLWCEQNFPLTKGALRWLPFRRRCRVFACEYVPTRIYVAVNNFLQLPDDCGFTNKKIAYVPLNIFNLTSLEFPVEDEVDKEDEEVRETRKLGFQFDEAWSPPLIRHSLDIYKASPLKKNPGRQI